MSAIQRAGRVACFGVLWIAVPAFAGAPERAHEILSSTMRENGVPGMSAGVAVDGEIVWAEALGKASLETGADVTTESRFRLGSVSKVVTAALCAKLAEEGLLDLDIDVRRYVPSFPDHGAPITVRQLLGHLGGIRHYVPADYDLGAKGGIIDLRHCPDTRSALALFENDSLVARPGERYVYSTFGYTLIMAAVEGATGESFLGALAKHVTGPLELRSLVGDDLLAVVEGRVDFHERRAEVIGNAIPVNPAYKWAGGGLLATATDLARFGAAHARPGFFSKATLAGMLTPQVPGTGSSNVGLGWRIDEDASGRKQIHHAGSMNGCRSMLLVYPQHGLAVALLGNLTGTPQDIKPVAERIAALWLN